jgi:hypothetical protein
VVINSSIPAARETVTVTIAGQHPVLGYLAESAKVFIGAVLALAAGWWLESRRDRRARLPLRIRLETEAHLVLLTLKRLVDALGPPAGANPQRVLQELKPLLESFDRVQDSLYLLRDRLMEVGFGGWYRKLKITSEQAGSVSYDELLTYRTRFVELLSEGNRLLDRFRKLY